MDDREKSFRELVDRQRDLIWHICSDYSLSAAWEVQDAFQEVLCVLWRDMDSFRGQSSERTWVYRVATSTMLMIKRKQVNLPQGEPPEYREEPAVPDRENYDHLMQLINNLEEKDSRIVHAYLHGFKIKEIAEMFKSSVPTVARRLAQAKKLLRTQYKQEE